MVQEISLDSGENEIAFSVNTPQDVNHARLFIKVTAAGSQTLESATAAHRAELEAALPGREIFQSFGYMLDGVTANQFEQVPGQDLSRQVIAVRDGRLYMLTFVPDNPEAGTAYDEMQTLYEMVMDSFSFLRQL